MLSSSGQDTATNFGYCVQVVGAGAFCLNRSGSRLVAAGRSAFKIISISSEGSSGGGGRYELRDSANLMGRRNTPEGRVVTDVAWSRSDESIVAISFAGPYIYIYDIEVIAAPVAKLRLNIDNIHSRTVNRIHFHPCNGSVLVTGSQDGTCYIMDLRERSDVRRFKVHAESGVRDVEFHPTNYNRFASAADSGSMAIWDMRRNDRPEILVSAHTDPILSIDWHLNENGLIATASRDKQIKVWDVSESSTPCLYTVFTSSSLARVKWRHQNPFHLATCSSYLMDLSVNIWDVRRPYVPLYSFIDHTDLVTEMFWCDARAIVSCAKNGNITVASVNQSLAYSKVTSPCCLDQTSYGQVAMCFSNLIPTQDRKQSSEKVNNRQDVLSSPLPSPPTTIGQCSFGGESHLTSLSASVSSYSVADEPPKQPSRKLSTTATSMIVDWHPPQQAEPSKLEEDDNDVVHTVALVRNSFTKSHVKEFAEGYILGNEQFSPDLDQNELRRFVESCGDNAAIAQRFGAVEAEIVWNFLPTLAPTFAESSISPIKNSEFWTETLRVPSSTAKNRVPNILEPSALTRSASVVSSDSDKTHRNRESDFFFETPNDFCPPKKADNERRRRISTKSRDLSDFQESEEIPLMFFAGSKCSWRPETSDMRRRCGLEGWDQSRLSTRLHEWSSSQEDESSDEEDDSIGYFVEDLTRSLIQQNHEIQEQSNERQRLSSKIVQKDAGSSVQPRTLSERSDVSIIRQSGADDTFPKDPLYSYIGSKIRFLVEMGQVHNAASIIIFIASFFPEVTGLIVNPTTMNEWIVSYAEILQRAGLMNKSREIMNYATSSEDAMFSSCLNFQCSKCLKLLDASFGAYYCLKCRKTKICAICRTVVKGLFLTCPGCLHGGHRQHLDQWFQQHTKCPAIGCGHECFGSCVGGRTNEEV